MPNDEVGDDLTKNGKCKCPGCGGLWIVSVPPPQRMKCLRCGIAFEPVVLRTEGSSDNSGGGSR